MVPTPIVAYNKFMYGVDHMEQLWPTLVTQCREKRVHMTIFTCIMDLSVVQSYAVNQKITEGNAGQPMSFSTLGAISVSA
jgi:hypothetical protein